MNNGQLLVVSSTQKKAYRRKEPLLGCKAYTGLGAALHYIAFILFGFLVHVCLAPFIQDKVCRIIENFLRVPAWNEIDLPQIIYFYFENTKEDFLILFILFCFALSYLCRPMSGCLLAICGGRVGIALGYALHDWQVGNWGTLTLTVFLVREALISACFLHLAARSASVSSHMRYLGKHQFRLSVFLLSSHLIRLVASMMYILLISVLFSFVFYNK